MTQSELPEEETARFSSGNKLLETSYAAISEDVIPEDVESHRNFGIS